MLWDSSQKIKVIREQLEVNIEYNKMENKHNNQSNFTD